MKKVLLFLVYASLSFAVELAPTNFDLRALTILVSQECDKNIIISKDIKNMSADYFIVTDVEPDILFSSYKKLIESKGLFLNSYIG